MRPSRPGSCRGIVLPTRGGIEAAHYDLKERGLPVGDIYHCRSEGRAPRVDPDHADYGSYAELADPDGNWLLQEVPSRAKGG